MGNVSVSIIVAVYNVEKYINKCIKSLIDQTYENIEIILVDDGSSDASPMLCDNWALRDTRIRVIHKKNGGLSDARNAGLNVANGDYVCFVDGDDSVEKKLVSQAYASAKQNDVDIVIYSNYDVTSNGLKTSHNLIYSQDVYRGEKNILQLFKESIGTTPSNLRDYDIGFAPWGKLYKRSLLINNGIKFQSERKLIYEDLMFLLDLIPYIKSASIINEPLYNYYQHSSSLTRSVNSMRFYRIKKQYYYLKNNMPYKKEIFSNEEILLRFKRTMLSYIRNCAMRIVDGDNAHKNMSNICHDDLCTEILDHYPIKMLPRNQKIFAYLLKYKMAVALLILIRIKKIAD